MNDKLLEGSFPVIQTLLSLLLFIAYFSGKVMLRKIIIQRTNKEDFNPTRVLYIKKMLHNLLLILCLIILGIIWEISIKGLSIYFASFFTVAGIALFAQWSVLSNITAGVILFFYFPIKIGTKVQILDGGNKIEGLVLDLTIFSVKLEDSDGNEIYIPNNIAIQKGIVSLK